MLQYSFQSPEKSSQFQFTALLNACILRTRNDTLKMYPQGTFSITTNVSQATLFLTFQRSSFPAFLQLKVSFPTAASKVPPRCNVGMSPVWHVLRRPMVSRSSLIQVITIVRSARDQLSKFKFAHFTQSLNKSTQ